MTRFALAASAFRRHRGRAVFTVLSVAAAFAIFTILAAIEQGLTGRLDLTAAQRLDTQAAVNAPLPIGYAAVIRTIPHVSSVTYSSSFSGYFRDPRQRVFVAGYATPSVFRIFPEFEVSPDQKQAFMRDRIGVLVGDKLAAKMGWHVGQLVPVQGGPAQVNRSTTWMVHIDGTFRSRTDDDGAAFAIAHYEYVNEGQPPGARKDTADFFTELVDSPNNVNAAAASIDARFANSSPDTRSQTQQQEALSYMRQFGDIGAIITYVGLAVFASMLLITGNTMANSVRERLGEFAMMRALGFSRLEVTLVVLREAAILVGAGAALGVVLGWALSKLMKQVMVQVLNSFSLTWAAVASAALLACLFALATGFLPGRRVARLPVAPTLRST
ncbi:MAG TPA: ABC transporter permease [Rhizomicrobium sp.]|nr:ABC transporter permease [Rhizomicrobium sp.]